MTAATVPSVGEAVVPMSSWNRCARSVRPGPQA